MQPSPARWLGAGRAIVRTNDPAKIFQDGPTIMIPAQLGYPDGLLPARAYVPKVPGRASSYKCNYFEGNLIHH